jgi:xylan 1,4-beta-xylosidase
VEHTVPLDFISTHEYPTDVQPLQRDIMKKVFTKARDQARPYPVIYSEYNSGLFSPGKHDDPYASAFVMYNVQEVQGIVAAMSYWVSPLFPTLTER